MPEFQEVFRMATQKVDQDHGALERQVTRQRKAARNRRVGVFATVLVLVAATVAAYAFTRGGSQDIPANSVPPPIPPGVVGAMVDLDTGVVTPLPATIATAGTYYAVSPDHTMVAYSDCCSPPDPLYVANIDGTGIHRVSAKGQDVYGAQWSPDGSLLVYQQRYASTQEFGNLFVQNLATGQRTQITHFDQTHEWNWWFTFPSFAPDRPYVFFQLPRGDPHHPVWDLWDVSVAGGAKTLVRHNAGWGGLGSTSLSSNLAYLSPVRSGDFTGRKLWIGSFDLRTVTPRPVGPEGHLRWLRWSPDGTQLSYSNRGWVYVLNVASGSARKVAKGGTAEWFDDHTLIVGPGG
jgi:hypothetical protein